MSARQEPEPDDFGDAGSPGARPGMPVDPARLWLSIKRGWRWIPIAGGIWLVLGVLVALTFVRHSYRAETVLVWDPGSQSRADTRQLATEAGSLTLPGFMREVKSALKLKSSIQGLQAAIEVWFDTGSNLVTVQASGATAKAATELANGLVQVFLQQQRRIAKARAEDDIRILQSDAAAARTRLERVRAEYDAFRSQHGISDIDREKELAIANVARLKEEQQAAQAEVDALDTRANELTSMSRSQAQIVRTTTVSDPDAVRLAQVRAELSTARSHLAAGHPRLVMLQTQEAELAASTANGTNVVSNTTTGSNPEYRASRSNLASARVTRQVAANRIKTYQEFLATAEQRVAEISGLEGKARSYLADIGAIESRLNEVVGRLTLAHDAARSPQIDWRVLTPAVEPEWPEASKRRMIAAGMPIAGMLVALVVLLARPLLNGRVFTAREAAFWANLPVIVSSGWPRNRDLFFTLIDELGDQGDAAQGYTLVLGATGREKPLAEELAYWLGGGAMKHEPAAGSEVGEVSSAARARAAAHAGVSGSTVLAPVMREAPVGIALHPQGTHAWLGTTEGPALRRAARMADRVIVLLTSGADSFATVAGLRTRLGREQGVGVVLLGLTPELLKLPDRVGNVEHFWRRSA